MTSRSKNSHIAARPGSSGDGTIYIKNEQPSEYSAWKEMDEITAGSFFLEGGSLIIPK